MISNYFFSKLRKKPYMADGKPLRIDRVRPTWIILSLLLSIGLLIGFVGIIYRPDRPVANLVPGTSSGSAFVVQIIRPRLGLPLGGILPPGLFGLDSHLGFDSYSPGATIGSVNPGRLELSADDWKLVLVFDNEGRIASESEVVFDMVFEEQVRRVRCRPGNPAIGRFSATPLGGSAELSGNFDLELAVCEDAETGTPLNWPPSPLILHGSFDRLPYDSDSPQP